MENERDFSPDEIHPDPDCDDCGGFRIKKYNGYTNRWDCPACDSTETSEEEEENE